jgi:hypothetical protein
MDEGRGRRTLGSESGCGRDEVNRNGGPTQLSWWLTFSRRLHQRDKAHE